MYRARKGAQPLRNGAPCSQPQISPAQRWGDAGKTEKKKKKYFCLFLLLPLLKADEAADPFPAGSCPGAQPVTPHPLRGPPPASPLRNSRISLPYAPPLLFSSFFFFSPSLYRFSLPVPARSASTCPSPHHFNPSILPAFAASPGTRRGRCHSCAWGERLPPRLGRSWQRARCQARVEDDGLQHPALPANLNLTPVCPQKEKVSDRWRCKYLNPGRCRVWERGEMTSSQKTAKKQQL